MKIRYNFHFHTEDSCDSACMKMVDAPKEMAALGMAGFGVTDHFHTQYNAPDILRSRQHYLEVKPPENFYFGVEVSCVSQKECDLIHAQTLPPGMEDPTYGLRDLKDFGTAKTIDLDAGDVKAWGVDFVVGGVHWPLVNATDRQAIIKDYLDQQLFLVNHPLVDVLAHPWDSLELAAGLWFQYRDEAHIDRTVFPDIPQEYNRELAEAIIRQRKLAELNLSVLDSDFPEVTRYYLKIFAEWREMGVRFTTGDDLHGTHFDPARFERVEKLLTEHGFTDEDVVSPIQWKKSKSS